MVSTLDDRTPASTRIPDGRRRTNPFALPPLLDGGRSRITAALQWALSAAVLIAIGASFFLPGSGDLTLLLVGGVVVISAGIAALLIPWARLSPWASIAIPLIDILGIAVLRQADSDSGYSLLLVFPCVWLSFYFGLTGYLASIVLLPTVVVGTSLAGSAQAPGRYTVTFAVVIVLLSTAAAGLARQMSAQRRLFARQSAAMDRTLRRAQRQEEMITEVLDTVDFGVIRIAPDGSTTIANEAHARLQTVARAPSGDAGAPAVFAADGVTALGSRETPFARAARGEVFDNQIVWFGSDARRRALSVTARRTHAPDGSDSGAVVISRDVTSELTALRARDSLVSSVSHELRTPLTSIIGYLELAVDDPEIPAPARSNLEVAERNASRLLEIVSDILMASSRSEMFADLTVSQQAIDIGRLARASGEAWRPAAAERAIEIDVRGAAAAPAYADPLRMRQVIDNLVSNAVKYNRDGGRVVLETSSDGVRTVVTIADTGVGVSEENLGRLFERFFRADDRSPGTGLGLAISRDLVRAHGGDISATSVYGAGTTFRVDLPATAESLDAHSPEDTTASVERSGTAP